MTDPDERKPSTERGSGQAIAIASLAVGGIAALAAIVVIPEARCWLHLDKCSSSSNNDNISVQQTGILGATDLKIEGDTSVHNSIEASIAAKSAQTGISANGPVTINGNVTIGNTLGSTPEDNCNAAYLQMQLDDRIGTLIMSPGDDEGSHPRRFRLIVGNPTKDCTAVVKSIFLKVEDVVADYHPALEAMTACYALRAKISPNDKGKEIQLSAKSYNYTPHSAPDQFSVDVFTKKRGFSYGIRFGIRWTDLKTQKTNETLSWIALAPFPDGQGQLFGGADTGRWRQDQLKKFRSQYDNNLAVKDASKEDPPHERQFDLKCEPG